MNSKLAMYKMSDKLKFSPKFLLVLKFRGIWEFVTETQTAINRILKNFEQLFGIFLLFILMDLWKQSSKCTHLEF